MKNIIILLGLLSSVCFAGNYPKRQYYINTPNGKVPIMTPQQYKELKNKDNDKENGSGVGQEFITRAEVSGGEIQVYIRGCNKISVGNINDKDADPEMVKKLKTIKNGDQLKIKMSGYGKCDVGSWKK